ncbi:MAG TPA: hypothetical protein VK983_04920 [Candidatus Limnocylindrales bacterium]|nr:hypothetical protein [Candidatus Limnocylindrales bacterium]
MDRIEDHQGGLLFVGNHDRQFEFVALMSYLARIGRTTMKNIIKFYVEGQVDWALGQVGRDITLPVYPRLLATDRRNKLNAELGSRLLFRRQLITTAESEQRTSATLTRAADELAASGVVNIFPSGSIVNNMHHPWRSGVGRIVCELPESEQENVLVVPYHADDINRARLVAAVALRGQGPLARQQSIGLQFGEPVPMSTIFAGLPEGLHSDPTAVTEVIRERYIGSLG